MSDILAVIFEVIVVFARSIWTLVGFVVAIGVAYVLWMLLPEWPHREALAVLCFILIFGGTLLLLGVRGEKI